MYFPPYSEISNRFFEQTFFGFESKEFYESILSLDIKDAWKKLADPGNSEIVDAIFANLRTNGTGHSGWSWACLVGYYREIAKNGVPDRFLKKNERFWVGGYYIPDYYPKFFFVASAAIIVSACRLK
jgi:hypothetical protein